LRRFTQFTTATGITNDEILVATLLTAVGEAVEEIYHVNGKQTTDQYVSVVKIITDYFKPQKDVEAEMLKFRHMAHRMGESIDAFTVRLKTAALGRVFHNVELEVNMQIIMTANSTRVRQKGKAETVTLADLLKLTRAIEMESQSAKASYTEAKVESIELFKQEKLNQIKGEKAERSQQNWRKYPPAKGNSYEKGNKCEKCNRIHKEDKYCPATNKEFLKFNEKGHFIACCKVKSNKDGHLRAIYSNQQEKETHEQSFESIKSDTLFSLSLNINKRACPSIVAEVNGHQVKFGIDTQASINAISWIDFLRIKDQPELQICQTATWSYAGKTPLKSPGKYTANIKANGKETKADIHVFLEENGNLLSFDTCCELGICNPKSFVFALKSDDEFSDEEVFSGF
jgi:hypothetical protein